MHEYVMGNWTGLTDAWRPEPGGALVGTVIGYRRALTLYGPLAAVDIRGVDGTMRSVWLTGELLREFARQQPRPGERVCLRRLDGREERFQLAVDRSDGVKTNSL